MQNKTSGGGYRAMLGLTGYLKAMKDSGALDCVTYIAGT
jgi:phospholipase A2